VYLKGLYVTVQPTAILEFFFQICVSRNTNVYFERGADPMIWYFNKWVGLMTPVNVLLHIELFDAQS